MSNRYNGASIRAICTDIDGTLLDSRRELSAFTISIFRQIRHKRPIILASSRMPRAMRHLQKELGIMDHPLICYNGGYVLKYSSDDTFDVIYSADIAWEICVEILGLGSSTSLHLSLYRNDEWYAPKMDEWADREATITKVSPTLMSGEEVLQLWKAANYGAHKIMCMGNANEIKSLEEILRSKFPHDIHVYHSKSTYLEIAPRIISKASALKLLLEKCYGISLEDVMAFGDNYNDIELIQSVGFGIAVNNAREEVKAVANDITDTSVRDGVAHAISKYLGFAL
jgi:Cof subfamily protein (haloacid dehalogenase superfamily)